MDKWDDDDVPTTVPNAEYGDPVSVVCDGIQLRPKRESRLQVLVLFYFAPFDFFNTCYMGTYGSRTLQAGRANNLYHYEERIGEWKKILLKRLWIQLR